jgi:hypothetical protein
MLQAERLLRVYGCAWRAVDGDVGRFWVAE